MKPHLLCLPVYSVFVSVIFASHIAVVETLNATMHIVEIGIKLKRLVAQVYVHTPRIRRSKMSKSHYIILGNSLGSLFFATWCAEHRVACERVYT